MSSEPVRYSFDNIFVIVTICHVYVLDFFVPANVMKLLEVVKGGKSAVENIVASVKLGKKLGKIPVVAGNCFGNCHSTQNLCVCLSMALSGFIGNRMIDIYGKEAIFLVEEGASPSQVDRVLKKQLGMAMGFFEMSDLSGNDVSWRLRMDGGIVPQVDLMHHLLPTSTCVHLLSGGRVTDATVRYSSLPDKLCEKGWFGQKTQRGWYKYDPAFPRKRIESEETAALIEQHRRDTVSVRNMPVLFKITVMYFNTGN